MKTTKIMRIEGRFEIIHVFLNGVFTGQVMRRRI